jgi:hypothetical protein
MGKSLRSLGMLSFYFNDLITRLYVLDALLSM